MVKGITVLRHCGTPEEQARAASFLAALGFGSGSGWDDDGGSGRSFLAPLGNLELVAGRVPADADLFVQVTDLDAVHQVAAKWAAQNDARVRDVEDTHWKSRLFVAEPAPGFKLAFWEWNDPLRDKPVAVEGDLSARGMRFGIVVARWNAVITNRLLDGALDALLRSGAARDDIEIVRVPGSWEVPNAARVLAETGRVDAVIALGCLIRGETAHYEAIYTEVARGLGQSQQETGVPHAFGVLTTETLEQALDRAGLKAGNKGFEAAVAAIEMVSVNRKVRAGEKSSANHQANGAVTHAR